MPTFGNKPYTGQVNNSGVASPGRGLTAGCWLGIDTTIIDPNYGFFHLEDFRVFPDASYTLTQKTAGTFAQSADYQHGSGLLDAASAVANQGPQIQFGGQGLTATAGDIVCFETRLKVDDVATAPSILAGLGGWDTAYLAAAGALDTTANGITDYAVFHAATADALGVNFVMSKAGATTDADTQTDLVTLTDGDVDTTEAAFVKLGFRAVVGEVLELFVNGVRVSSASISPTIFPDATIYPTFAIESAGVDSIMEIDWYAVGFATH